jgi:hypothetical protein
MTCTLPTLVHVCPAYASYGRSPYVTIFYESSTELDRVTTPEKKGFWHNPQHAGWLIRGSVPSFSPEPTCRYPEDWVPLHTSSKLRWREIRALTRAHVSRGSSSHLLAQGSSGAATCPVAPAPASWLRAALEPPRVSWLQLLPPSLGQLQSHIVSYGSSSRLLTQGNSKAATCPMELLK